jgi:hypothetical protein
MTIDVRLLPISASGVQVRNIDTGILVLGELVSSHAKHFRMGWRLFVKVKECEEGSWVQAKGWA